MMRDVSFIEPWLLERKNMTPTQRRSGTYRESHTYRSTDFVMRRKKSYGVIGAMFVNAAIPPPITIRIQPAMTRSRGIKPCFFMT